MIYNICPETSCSLRPTNREYYDAFVSIQRGLFNTRDRAEHTRKRKTVSHTFSAKSIGQFEQYIHGNLELLVQQWDRRSKEAEGGYYRMDALHWYALILLNWGGEGLRGVSSPLLSSPLVSPLASEKIH